jgi:ketosteroid isomerase-like protein
VDLIPAPSLVPVAAAEDLVGRLFAAIDAQHWSELRTSFTEHCVYERPGYGPMVGIEALLRFYRLERIISSGHHHIEHVTSGDATVACWGRFTGRSHAGDALDERFADTYVVDRGRIAHRRSFFYRPAV